MRKPIALFSLALPLLAAPLLAQTTQIAPLPLHTHNNLAFRREPLLSMQKTLPQTPLTTMEQTTPVLNCFTFDPASDAAQVITAQGWQDWLAQQLHPESIDALNCLAYPPVHVTSAMSGHSTCFLNHSISGLFLKQYIGDACAFNCPRSKDY